jgi:mannose-1-phosphate guanylyltransferase/MurNAc alpha-1-phosphate uridylyltransferase
MLDGWDGRTVRMLTRDTAEGERPEFSGRRFAGFSLIPWAYLRHLTPDPADLVRTVWRPAEAAGDLELVPYAGDYIDTGTPAHYLAANLHAVGGKAMIDDSAVVTGRCESSVVGAGATVHGSVTRCVVWPGATVAAGEDLLDAVRVGNDLTVGLG